MDVHTDELNWFETNECMTSEEVAAEFGVTVESFYHANSTGQLNLPAYKYKTRKFYKRSDVEQAKKARIKFIPPRQQG